MRQNKQTLAEQGVSTIETELGQKNIGNLLLKYSTPAIIATAATSIYNIVDRIFIGQIVGPLAITGITIALPLMSLISAFGTLIGSGAATIISIRMGENRREDALRTLANALILDLIISVAISLFGLIFLDEILCLFGASDLTMPYAKAFMQIIFIGTPITQLFFSLNTIMRASGYPAKTMCLVLVSMLVNLLFVYVLIYKLHFGIEGAAIATIGGQFVGLIWTLTHFCKSKSNLHFKAFAFSLRWNITRHIFSIGMSSFLIHICSSVVVAIFNWQLKDTGGDYAIGAYGIINTVVNFVTAIVLGLSQGMQPIVGYNFGAKSLPRMLRALWMTIWVGTAITTLGFICMRLFPLQIAHCFTNDMVMTDLIRSGMMIYTVMFPLIGFQVVVSNFFQSIGKPRVSIFLSISRQLLFLVPAVCLLPYFYSLEGIWYAMPVADVLSTILTAIMLMYYYKKLPKEARRKKVSYESLTTYLPE